MKSSLAVQAFKSIASRIHPQLPLSPKESQRLLNALTSSFNHQLDREFPSADAAAGKPLAPSSAPPTVPPSASPTLSSSATTDIHLAAILTNPLFGRPAQPSNPTNPALSQLKTKAKHPVQIFEDSVARGQATIDIGRLCLNAFRASLDNLPESERNAHICDMAAGTRVLRWLWSSGKIHAYSFAEDRRFLDALTSFLLAEANESAIWDLMETSSRQITAKDSPPAREIRRRKGLILCSLVKAHMTAAVPHGAPAAAAISAFLRASDVNQTSPSSTSSISLVAAGALLSRHLVHIDLTSQTHPVDAPLYDRFIESCPLWDKSSSDRALYRVASLKLHHPASPSARDALYFIRHLKQSSAHPFLSPSTDTKRADVFKFLFDTVNLLQTQGFQDDAAWVMEFMQQSFPNHLSEQETPAQLNVAPSSEPLQQQTHPALPLWRIPDLG